MKITISFGIPQPIRVCVCLFVCVFVSCHITYSLRTSRILAFWQILRWNCAVTTTTIIISRSIFLMKCTLECWHFNFKSWRYSAKLLTARSWGIYVRVGLATMFNVFNVYHMWTSSIIIHERGEKLWNYNNNVCTLEINHCCPD